jgi:cytochrome c oxidase assembly protein Cox11
VTRLRKKLRVVFSTSAALAGLAMPLLFFLTQRTPNPHPVEIAKAFYKASYARDFDAAYAYISSVDRQVRDRATYIDGKKSFSGFALELSKRLADQVGVQIVKSDVSADRARLTLDYKAPAADELSELLFNWDQNKLNALSRAEQRRIMNAVDKLAKAENTISVAGRETFNLVKERGRWKISLDWASGINVSFEAAAPVNDALEVEVLEPGLVASRDEPFQTSLKLRNRGHQEIVARIDHRIEPKDYAGHVAMIACGFLRPLTLQPGEERQVSSAYLLDPEFPKNTKLRIAYQFSLTRPQLGALN